MKFVLKEQSDYESRNPLTGLNPLQHGVPGGLPRWGWWEVWIEVLPEEATPWEEVGG